MHAAFWPERMPRARKWQRATISGARGSAGRRRAVVGGAAEFPLTGVSLGTRGKMSKENPLIFFGEKAVWAGEAALNMQKSSDKKEVILTREGAI